MKVGARILKTGITLVLAIYISYFLGLEPVIYAAIAATFAIQPSVIRSWKYGIEQIQANLVGATIAILFSTYVGTHPIFIAIAVMLVIGINLKFHFERTIPLSIVTVLSIMEGGSGESEFLMFAIDRFLLIFVGLFSAIIVNAILYPPKYDKQLASKLMSVEDQISSILRIILDKDKNQRLIRTSISSLDNDIEDLWNLLKFEEEAKVYFKKKLPFSASRKLVIYKAMIESNILGIQLFRTIEKYQNTLSDSATDLFNDQLVVLANYQDRIYSKFEGKIHSSNNNQSEENILQTHVEIYDNIANSAEEPNKALDILSILTVMREYTKNLSHLDQLITNYYSHHKTSKI